QEYLACQEAGICHTRVDYDRCEAFQGNILPVTCVAVEDAQSYCAWAHEGGELPTESQWEYAARGPCSLAGVACDTGIRDSEKDEPLYIWEGRQFDCDAANVEGCYGGRTPPGSVLGDVSWAGIYDLSGNVSELTSGLWTMWYGGPTQGDVIAVRGAAYDWPWQYTRVSDRTGRDPLNLGAAGFRCVAPASGSGRYWHVGSGKF
ncbi:unnamed protein product, partial [marine sediment metagenome]